MKSLVILVVLVGCGNVKDVGGAPPDASSIDAPNDGPPARFASGAYGFEDLAGGHPTLPHDIASGGAQQTKPAPNAPNGGGGVFLVDCNGNSGAYGFGCAESQQHVPEGRKFIVYADHDMTKPLEFTFPSEIGTFSVAISQTDGSPGSFRLVAIDANDVDLTFSDVTTGPVASWRNTRVAVARASGFRKAQLRANGFSSSVIAIDAVEWTSD